ncbi:MAG: hypothetical protein VB861_15130 [Planctomycetaceae bacterium]
METDTQNTSRPRRSWRKRSVLALATTLLVLLACELIGLVGLVLVDGSLDFSALHEEQRERAAGIDRHAPPPLDEILHPHLGWVLNPDVRDGAKVAKTRFPINRFGFLDHGNPLARRSPERLRVAIIGGSVAWYFSMHGREQLEARLGQAAEFQGRQIEVISLALSGYKQPQQLMTLAWMLSLGAEYDVVINIDGFNEVTLHPAENHSKKVHVAYPRGWHERVRELPRSEIIHTLYRHTSLGLERRHWAAWFVDGPLPYSPLLNFIWRTRDNQYRKQLGDDQVVIASQWLNKARVYMHTGPDNTYADPDEMYDQLVALWQRCSRQLEQLCRTNGIRYLHVLQPNQYVEGSKPMGDAERDVAIEPRHKYRPGVIQGYPRLQKAGAGLTRAGVDFLDLTMVFAGTANPIYIDDCCHYNPQGNRMLADAIADRLLESQSSRP